MQARAALAAIVDFAPRSAVLLDSGLCVHVEDVKVGSLLSVKAGEMVPIDGEVVSGKCSVDESSLTGESMPLEKDVGATVWAGTVNMSGKFAHLDPGDEKIYSFTISCSLKVVILKSSSTLDVSAIKST